MRKEGRMRMDREKERKKEEKESSREKGRRRETFDAPVGEKSAVDARGGGDLFLSLISFLTLM